MFPAPAAAADLAGSIDFEVRHYDGTLDDGDGIAWTKFACALANMWIP